jgi:hypothetical protein
MFNIRFPIADIAYWAAQYTGDIVKEDGWFQHPVPLIQERGCFLRDEFLMFCDWKSPRPRKRYESNTADYIQEVTAIALSARSERLRINVLKTLEGVSLPVASVLLHFAHRDPYPIIDFRAVWSLGLEEYPGTFEFWWAYTEYCRQLADECQVNMRTLDRALWQYSKVNQSPS